ncbi:unnamed protein product [Citrullus colocynthis]|uniref:Uncharacterized protein n=1 Tax=Citrullus colocynthis TaxID=252529 RepID=A0ABP0ZBF7_9ROSI
MMRCHYHICTELSNTASIFSKTEFHRSQTCCFACLRRTQPVAVVWPFVIRSVALLNRRCNGSQHRRNSCTPALVGFVINYRPSAVVRLWFGFCPTLPATTHSTSSQSAVVPSLSRRRFGFTRVNFGGVAAQARTTSAEAGWGSGTMGVRRWQQGRRAEAMATTAQRALSTGDGTTAAAGVEHKGWW